MRVPMRWLKTTSVLLYCLFATFVWSDEIKDNRDSNIVGDNRLPREGNQTAVAAESPPQEIASVPSQNSLPNPSGGHHLLHHLQHLGGRCRHLKFLASLALGAFITRVIKDSPLSPLPMPPLPNSLHWNLVRVPAHLAGQLGHWVEKHPAGLPVILNQGVAGLARSSSDDTWTSHLLRIRKDLSRQLRSSPNILLSAVERTLKPLKLIHHAIGMHKWFLKWCH